MTETSNVPIPGSAQEGQLGQTPDHTADDWQESSAAVTAEVEQLRKQLAAERQQVEMLKADNATIQLQVNFDQCVGDVIRDTTCELCLFVLSLFVVVFFCCFFILHDPKWNFPL